MNVLVLYGTTEGQTREIARFVADRLAARGHPATLVDAASAAAGLGLDRRTFGAALVAASLHAGHYQASVVDLVRRDRAALEAVPNAFVSVSLSAAGRDPEDRDGLARCVAEFERRTGWTPREVHHAAGAFRFSRYGPLKRWAMRYVAWRRSQPTDASRDRALTDWDALGAFVDGFAAKLAAG